MTQNKREQEKGWGEHQKNHTQKFPEINMSSQVNSYPAQQTNRAIEKHQHEEKVYSPLEKKRLYIEYKGSGNQNGIGFINSSTRSQRITDQCL